jgi:hypothetical protein
LGIDASSSKELTGTFSMNGTEAEVFVNYVQRADGTTIANSLQAIDNLIATARAEGAT